MKNFSLFLILLSIAFCNSANAQENYNPNSYKYRFQKLRGFSTYYNLGNSGQFGNGKNKDTLYNINNTDNIRSNKINLSINGNYFKNINTESLQHSSDFNFGLSFGSGSDKRELEYKDQYNTNFYNDKSKGNYLNLNLNFNSNNRFYNASNKFKLLNYRLGTQNSISRNTSDGQFTNTTSNYDRLIKQNNSNTNASLQLGFGTGRLEYVADPIMAAFMLKDLQKKAGIGALTDEQVEAIGKGITTIRNTRFIDFRFRLIDQLEMLDSVLQANGVKSNKASRYFTTINDNWLYANQFGRYTGKRWTFYIDNSAYGYNEVNENNQKLNSVRHTKNTFFNRRVFNGLGINFDKSSQNGIYKQNAWGVNIISGLKHHTNGNKFEDSIGLSSYIKTETKNKPDVINTNIGVYYEYLWQPNTRTFFTARVNPYLNSNISRNGLRKSNPTKDFSNTNDYGVNTDFRYFKFFTARLSTFVNLNFNISNSRNVNSHEQSSAPSPIITSKNIGNNFNFNHNFTAGITYTLF